MNRDIGFSIVLENDKDRLLHIHLNEEVIGYCSLIYDVEARNHEGILILKKVIEDRELYILVRSIQQEFVDSEEELFIETYYGVHKGLMCDEHPEMWDKLIG